MGFFRRRKLNSGLATNRIEAFSDGVIAIAITVLVLGIDLPRLTALELAQGKMLESIIAIFPELLSYAISFGIIGIFWVGHSVMFNYIIKTDRILLWLNTLFLMLLAFIPFPTALIGLYNADKVAEIMYGLVLVLAGLVFYAMWHHASTDYHLIDKRLSPKLIKLGKKIILMAPIINIGGILIAFVNPTWSLAVYILVPVLYIIPSPIDQFIEFEEE